MTGVPRPAEDELLDAARWCARLAQVLGDVGRRVALLGELVDRDWPDGQGREWAERTSRVGAALAREAEAAAELGGAYARQAGDPPPAAAPPPLPGPAGAGSRRAGMRLGGVEAGRVEDDRGMRIAELPPG